MVSRVVAIVEPALLIWARESAGLTVEEAAKKLRVPPVRLEGWESGDARPTVKQLRRLGRAYRRPLAVFYLPQPPKTFMPLRDYRRLPGEIVRKLSPQLALEVRRAHERREIALELYEELGEPVPEFVPSLTLTEDPEAAAHRLRNLLGVTYERQVGWTTPREALNAWRSALEGLGVLVFQAAGVDPQEMRAFSISEFPLPVVAVSIRDSLHARIFSLLHEFVHVALRMGGVCDLEEGRGRAPENERVEVVCNRIAGAILVPGDCLLAEDVVAAKPRRTEWSDAELGQLADGYGVSREVILRRLLVLGRTTAGFYQEKREALQKPSLLEKSKRGFASPSAMVVSTAGHLFVRLVLDSYYQERITAGDVSDLLEVRLKHLPRIERAVFGAAAQSGAAA